jgi:hypothetical protein
VIDFSHQLAVCCAIIRHRKLVSMLAVTKVTWAAKA